MVINKLIDEDFVNYKKPAMVIGFPHCTFKCDRECGMCVCQNSALAKAQTLDVNISSIITRYMENPLTSAVVLQGLEPLDDMVQLEDFILSFREHSSDDVVVYTGYNRDESKFKEFFNWVVNNSLKRVVIKYGRFIPNRPSFYSKVLGITLASDNQRALCVDDVAVGC